MLRRHGKIINARGPCPQILNPYLDLEFRSLHNGACRRLFGFSWIYIEPCCSTSRQPHAYVRTVTY